jgi:hypothetical protein
MRATCGALLAAAALSVLAPPAGAAPAPRALIAFMPTHLAFNVFESERGMAVGLTSPTLGGYKRPQMSIDISQGARLSTRAYTRKLPRLALEVSGGRGQVAGWGQLVRRARDAPGDVVPGLLASTVGGAAYVGVSGAENTESFAAADRSGVIRTVSIGSASSFARRALRVWRPGSLLVARLPQDDPATLDELVDARRPGDLIVVIEAPPPRGLKLLPTGVIGAGIRDGVIRSGTTRRNGLIAAPDISVTVLDTLGIKKPKKMQGDAIESRAGHGVDYVERLDDRLGAILPHRSDAVKAVALCWGAALLLLFAVRRRDGVRDGLRIVFLAAIWLPALALLTAALKPSGTAEALILALGSLGLGSLTDMLLPWPAAPMLPAAVTFGAHAIDLAFGSPLIAQSIAGPNPKGGSRFFGIGNELEVILALTVLVGVGAALTYWPRVSAPRAFALAALVAGAIIGAGRLGADVGGVITLGAGGAAAVVTSLPRGPSRRAIALAVVVPVLAVGALLLLDLAIGGGAHLTNTLSSSSGPGDLGKVLVRRWRLSVAGLTHGTTPISVGIAVALLVYGAVRYRELLEPVSGERERPFRAGVIGAFFATVVGALANDSGPMIVLIGTVSLLLTVGYVKSSTRTPARPRAWLTSPGCA